MGKGEFVAEGSKSKKPRVRKSAPTIREQAEAARADAEREKPRRVKKAASKTNAYLRKTRITRNPITALLAKIGRGILKVLKWLVPKYFVNAWREVRLVTWPTRRETWRLTLAVFVFCDNFWSNGQRSR